MTGCHLWSLGNLRDILSCTTLVERKSKQTEPEPMSLPLNHLSYSSLSETDQQFLSENLLLGSKKKNRQHNPSKTTQQSNNQQILSQHQLPEVHLSNHSSDQILPVPKTTIIQAITTPISLQTNTDTTTDRPESELSTISVAELNNAITVHPNQAFQTASSSAGSSAQNSAASTAIQPQYRHAPHQMDYSQMFQISLTQTTISTNPDEL